MLTIFLQRVITRVVAFKTTKSFDAICNPLINNFFPKFKFRTIPGKTNNILAQLIIVKGSVGSNLRNFLNYKTYNIKSCSKIYPVHFTYFII